MEDQISELPDDILVSILSLLPMKDASRTSVLSKRWRHPFSYIPILNFDPGSIDYESLILDDNIIDKDKFQLLMDRYIEWVDSVVTSHNAPTIDEFRIHYEIEHTMQSYIDYWVEFAVEKRVKRLELNHKISRMHHCNLPNILSSSCDSLTYLQLFYVDVTGEALENVICNCRALEFLSVTGSRTLVGMKIDGPSLKLKSLRIYYCLQIKYLEISAPNLVSFCYFGTKLSLSFKSMPKLVEFSASGQYGKYLMKDVAEFSSCASQIEMLALDLHTNIRVMEAFPICSKLKILNVAFTPQHGEDLFRLCSLLQSCPVLHKFILQLELWHDAKIHEMGRAREREASIHATLEIVEIIGFVGYKIDTRFVKYLLETAVCLKKIVIDPRHPYDIQNPKNVGTRWQATKKDRVRRAMKVASRHLSSNLKPGMDLEIRSDFGF